MIADLKAGDQMDLDVLVNSYELKYSDKVRNNYFLSMHCKDSSGEISVKVFDMPKNKLDELVDLLDDSKFIHIQGNVEDYKGNVNVKAQNIEFLDEPEDMSYYEKCAPVELSILKERLQNSINRIEKIHFKQLVEDLIGQSGTYREKFMIWPAAKSMHHAYRHGLLQHSLEVFSFVESDFDGYQKFDPSAKSENINWDALKTAALIHDLAKVEELSYDSGITNYTSSGDLIGHLNYGAMWAYHAMQKIENFPKEDAECLLHILLSHHGRKDWGAAVEPKTVEAEFFHQADQRSAVANKALKSKTQG